MPLKKAHVLFPIRNFRAGVVVTRASYDGHAPFLSPRPFDPIARHAPSLSSSISSSPSSSFSPSFTASSPSRSTPTPITRQQLYSPHIARDFIWISLCTHTHPKPLTRSFLFSLLDMQTRRSTPVAVPALAISLPPLPRRRSNCSLMSTCSSPRTPRSCGSPTCSAIFFNPKRKSSDSWNSFEEIANEMESEWTAEHERLLTRTLDGLPAHLLTPFHGVVPPANLLDKIARGVAAAKGPSEWPHSVRATRAKLLVLARQRAKEERKPIREEDDECLADGEDVEDVPPRPNTRSSARKPLYRQNSMDFMASNKLEENPPRR